MRQYCTAADFGVGGWRQKDSVKTLHDLDDDTQMLRKTKASKEDRQREATQTADLGRQASIEFLHTNILHTHSRMSSSAIGSVIIAAASAVIKTALIGAAGFFAVKRPKKSPLLPMESVNMLSRMSFVLFSLPLIYTGIAANISLDQLQSLWFMIVAATVVIGSSYIVATILGSRLCPCFGMHHSPDFDALRISAAFPNTLAIPILVFPTLCEYDIVYTAFGQTSSVNNNNNNKTDNNKSPEALIQQCKQASNGMVFAYFFAWSLLFWSVGNQLLINAGTRRQEYQSHRQDDEEEDDNTMNHTHSMNATFNASLVDSSDPTSNKGIATADHNNNNDDNPTERKTSTSSRRIAHSCFTQLKAFILPMVTSSGFIVMILGFLTACIRPLQAALFKPGGVLRFLGSALESLGSAATSLTCIVVAASLAVVHSSSHTTTTTPTDAVPEKEEDEDEPYNPGEESNNSNDDKLVQPPLDTNTIQTSRFSSLIGNDLELPIITSSNNRTKRRHLASSIQQFGSSLRRRSTLFLVSIQRNPTLRMHIWYNISRLVVSPAIACGILIALDCGGLLSSFPPLGKLVIIVNAAVPGALIVVVVLKAKGLSESASIVARIYLPSYLLSIVTIAGWTAVGLIISIPKENGQTYCSAR